MLCFDRPSYDLFVFFLHYDKEGGNNISIVFSESCDPSTAVAIYDGPYLDEDAVQKLLEIIKNNSGVYCHPENDILEIKADKYGIHITDIYIHADIYLSYHECKLLEEKVRILLNYIKLPPLLKLCRDVILSHKLDTSTCPETLHEYCDEDNFFFNIA